MSEITSIAEGNIPDENTLLSSEDLHDEIDLSHTEGLFNVPEYASNEVHERLSNCGSEIVDSLKRPLLLHKRVAENEIGNESVRARNEKNYINASESLYFLEHFAEYLQGDKEEILKGLVIKETFDGDLGIGVMAKEEENLGNIGNDEIRAVYLKILRENPDRFTQAQINFRLIGQDNEYSRGTNKFYELGSFRLDVHHVSEMNEVQVDVEYGSSETGISEKHHRLGSLSNQEDTLEVFELLEDVFLINLVENIIAIDIDDEGIVPNETLDITPQGLAILNRRYAEAKSRVMEYGNTNNSVEDEDSVATINP